MIALNPAAFRLERDFRKSGYNKFYDIKTNPVYKIGEFSVYKYANRYYVTCRNNIIVLESTGIPNDLIKHLIAGTVPEDYSKYTLRCMLKNYEDGIYFAHEVGFEVHPI